MRNTTGFYPSLKVDTAGVGVVSNAGASLLVSTMAGVGVGSGPVVGAEQVAAADRGSRPGEDRC